MDNHQHPVRFHQRLLSWAISAMLATQPLLPAVAATLTPSAPGTQIDKAGNGVPVVNIATPNGAGISHNQFKDYNVGKEGLILNNATGQLNQTQLGGLIQNNPNLKAGQEARGIINEVNGGNRSQLQGFTEVAGKAANVMVANPYGITCNGCGFINTPNVTLTTGKPVFDAAGNLLALDVEKGAITIEGQGLNASQADALSIISRATEVNAEIHAKDLKVIAGANRVDANGNATAIAGEGAAPVVAVDTGALGGMYANRIRLVSSDKGVGVNLGNLNARQGDIQLDASGRLAVKNSLASGSLSAKGESVALSGEHKASGPLTVSARRDVTVNGGQLASDGNISLSGNGKIQISGSQLTAGNDVNLSAQDITLDGASRGDASRDIRVEANGTGTTQGKLTAGRDLSLSGGKLTNSGTLASEGNMQVQGSQLASGGLLQSGGIATLKAGQTTIGGAVSGTKGLNVQADTLTTTSGAQLQTDGAMNLAARQTTLNGTQAAKGALTVTADNLQHSGKSSGAAATLNGKAIVNNGTLVAPALTINGDSLTNSGLLQGSRTLNLVTALLNNQRGGTVSTDGSLTLAVPDLSNAGLITTGGNLNLSGNALTNSGEINAANLTVKAGRLSNQQGGLLLAQGSLTLDGQTLDNAGQLAADKQSLSFDSINNQGAIQGNSALSLAAREASNQGTVLTDGEMTIAADTLTNSGALQATSLVLTLAKQFTNAQNGSVSAANSLILTAPAVNNAGLLSASDSTVKASSLINNGTIQGANQLTLDAATLNHLGGVLFSGGNLNIRGTKLTSAGLMQGKILNLATGDWINTGNALSEQTASLRVSNTLNNQGKILGQNGIDLSAASLDNSGWLIAKAVDFHGDLVNGGLIQGGESLALTGGALANRSGGQLLSGGQQTLGFRKLDNQGVMQGKSLVLTADEWTNGGYLQAQDALAANVKGTLNNGGTLLSQNIFELHAGNIINQGSLAADKLSLTAPSLVNSGLLQGNTSLQLAIPQIRNLQNGQLISGGALNLALDSLENEGLLQVNDALSLTGEEFTNRGSILANTLAVDLRGALENLDNGQLVARGNATFAVGSLNNSGVLAADKLNLRSGDTRNSGTVQGAGNLDINAQRLDNQAAGKLLSGGALRVNSGATINAGAWQGKTIDADLAVLANTGSINGIDRLTGRIAGDLSNGGQLWSQGNLSLEAAGLSNTGKIIAKGLTLSGDALINNGLWQGAEGLSIAGDTLTTGANSRTLAGGLLSLNIGQLTTGGTLQGQNADVTAGGWRHEGSLLGLDGLNANVAGTLNNSGDLLSHGGMEINALTLTSTGSLLSEGDMLLTGNSLDNRGALQGKNLTLNQTSVTNTGTAIGLESLTLEARQTLAARMLMAAPLMTLVNGGQMLSGGTLSVNGGSITNAGAWQGQRILLAAQSLQNSGSIQSADALQMTLAGNLAATAGSKITAGGNAVLDALSLTNQGQWLAKNLTLKGGSLSNGGEISGVNGLTVALSGAFTQQQDKTLLTAGKLTLEAASVDNRGRIQGAELDVKSGTLANNGRLQGDNALALNLTGELNNGAAGTILSQKTLTVTTPSLINYGILQGGTVSRISGMNTARNDGKILSGGELTFSSGSLTNNGWLQAGQLALNATTAINSGTLLAEQQGTLAGNSLTNTGMAQGGNLTVNYQQLTNGGTVLGSSGLNVTAGQVNHQAAGKLFSGGNLLLTSTGLDQLGQVVALGNLTLKLTNAFTAKNVLAAGNTLSVSSNGAITNNAVMQGQAVNLAAGGALTNNSQITTGSGASTLSGSQIAFADAGTLQAGGDITVNSSGNITVNGFTGTSGSLTLNAVGSLLNTALLYAGNNMYLLANSIKNQRGDILAGNSLWMQRDMAGNANTEVVNTSGSIETQRGDITVKTGHLLNTREGLSVKEVTTPGTAFLGLGDATLKVHYSLLPTGNYGYYTTKQYVENSGVCGGADGGCPSWLETTYHYVPFEEYATQKFALSQTSVEVYSTGGAGRIASGQHLNITAGTLENQASNILAAKNIMLQGTQLSNQSWQSGTATDSLVYQYGTGRNQQEVYATNALPENGVPGQHDIHSKYIQEIPFYLVGRETTQEPGEIYRSVIQAGGNVVANFTSDISNTTTTANAGGVSSTITAPSLNTLSNQSIGGGAQKQNLANADKAAVGSPQWSDQLQNALQQINGGSGLDSAGGNLAGLDNFAVNGKGDASLGNAATLENGAVPGTGLKDSGNNALKQHQGSGVDTSAWPLPSGNNGYFVPSTDPDSPYLITVNPKLDGLGQLDQSLFGDLYKLTGMKPGSAPQETNSAYTDRNKFLGSSYFLERLNLHPEYDYRFLGDAAFDTRYVSNYVLNQTGNRYINGIGSDLEQMQYLMDNAAHARGSLGLQFGVALTAAQIAALDHSILWWEAATVNGQTVMIPKVYLSPKDVTVNNGSVIAGNNVSLSGGNITNSGSTLSANNSLSLDSQNSISNLNGGLMNAGGNLQLSALGDINNIGSTISGKTVALESLDGSISNITLAETWSLDGGGKYGHVGLSGTTLGNTASITALDSLSLSAGQDITLTGANVAAGGNLLMDAWGDIAVTANQVTGSYSQSGFRGKDATSNASTTSQGSTLTAGGSLGMHAGNDLTLSASAMSAGGNATLTAGNDLNLSAVQTGENASKGKSESHSTDIARTTVSSGGDLQLAAGRDINSQAAGLAAENDVAMQAGRDVNLLAQETTEGNSYTAKKKVEINESVRQQGTEIASGGNTTIVAGRDVNAEAAQVTASGDIGVAAGRDVNLTTATESDYHYREETKTSKGFLKKTTTHTVEEDSATYEKGTSLSGNNISLSAGNDLTVKGSNVIGDSAVTLQAGNDVNILAATDEQSAYRLKEKKTSGLMGTGGLGVTIGSKSSRHQVNEDGVTQSQSVSTVGSTGGNVNIIADGKAHISGADVVAAKNLNVVAGEIQVDPGNDLLRRQERYEQKQSGVTLSVSSAVTDAAMAASKTLKRGEEVSDDRLKALYAVKAAQNAWIAGAGGAAVAGGVAQGSMNAVKVEVSVGASKATSESDLTQNQVRGSNLSAGGDITMVATGGKGTSGDLHITGSGVMGDNVTLVAQNDLLLDAATNNREQSSKNNSSGWNVGVHVSLGQETGIGVSASGYQSKGTTDGKSTEYVNTRVNARDELSMSSGRDTVIAGAQALGEKITADVGRDLLISSQQDTDEYHSKQTDVSGGASFTFGSMTGSASLSINKSKTDSNYASVGEQSGFFAGDKGFDITVGKHTQLDGAVIASTATVDKNHLDTGTLGWNVIENNAEYSSGSKGISGGFSSGNNESGERANSGGAVPIIGIGSHGDTSGTTQSAIAAGSITVRDGDNQKQDVAGLSRDTDSANGSIDKIFDKKKVEEQQELAAVFGQVANNYAGDLGAKMGWGADSKEKAAIHGVIGAIQASFGGGNALAGGLAGLSSEALGQMVNDYLSSHTTLDAAQKAAITQWAAAVSGGAVGGIIAGNSGAQSGAAASLDAERYNRQLHQDERAEIKKLANGDEEKEQRLLAEACRRVDCVAEFALDSDERQYYEALIKNQAATPEERKALDNYWITQFKDVYGNYPAYAGTEDKQLFQYGEADKLTDSQQFSRNQYVTELSNKLGVDAETARQITEGMSLATLIVAAKNGKDLPGKNGKVSSGAENAATYPKLKDDLIQQNLANISKQDPRLAAVVQGDNGRLNYGVGSGTKVDADRLGKIWVGEGARLTNDGTGLMSADGTRVYRYPKEKPNAPFSVNPTGTQANFETYNINPVTGQKVKVGDGHLNIFKGN